MADIIRLEALACGLHVDMHELDPATGPAIVIRQIGHHDHESGILMLGHYDTVHALGSLARNPCRVADGKFFGPGTYDMKAGLLLCLSAMAVLNHRESSQLPLSFLIVPDEETGSHHSRELIETLARSAKFALVAEPARAKTGFCVTARKGTGKITLAAHGCAAHAGVAHDKGRSAIRELAHKILALESLTDYAKGTTINVGRIEGGSAVNVVPSFARLIADYRVTTAQADIDLRARLAAFQPIDPDVRIEVQARLNRPPMMRSEQTAQLYESARRLACSVDFTLGEAPLAGGGSDANFTAALGVPTLDGLGADGDGAHTDNEYVDVTSLGARGAVWRTLLENLR